MIWRQSRDFCAWVGRVTGAPIDLPTEAQWAYAARSRGELWVTPSKAVPVDEGKYNVGQLDGTIVKKESVESRAEPIISRPVGTEGDNAIGLSDDFGRGNGLARDWFDKNYYTRSPRKDPLGPDHGSLRSVRYAT